MCSVQSAFVSDAIDSEIWLVCVRGTVTLIGVRDTLVHTVSEQQCVACLWGMVGVRASGVARLQQCAH